MFARITPRRPIALAVAMTLSFGLLATPATARAARVWYVAPHGSGGGSCQTPDVHRIQRAVDASGRGDTILVCPGTYRGYVRIEGAVHDRLTIRSIRPWTGVLKPPRVMTPGRDLVDIIDVAGVTIQWLTLVARAGGSCERVDAMVRTWGATSGVSVRANRISTAGDGSLRGACGFDMGIDVAGGAAVVAYNVVSDHRSIGIRVDSAVVVGNEVRYGHEDEIAPGTCGPDAIQGSGTGLVIGGNVTTGGGINVVSAAGGLIRHNTVRWGERGISLTGSDDAVVAGNRVLDSCNDGFLVGSSHGFVLRANVVRRTRGYAGIEVVKDTAGTFRDNDFRSGARFDCVDTTTGSGTGGTSSRWVRNLGDPAIPLAICGLP